MGPSTSRLARVRVRDLPMLLSALGTVALVECGLRSLPLPRLARLLGTPLALESSTIDSPPGSGQTVLPGDAARRIAAARRVLRRWPLGDTCLRQALASGHLIRRYGPTLHVGVAKVDDRVRAHAWIVVDGTIIDPLRVASSYLRLEAPSRDGQGR
jgi:Transglutaminase-like superfamily